MSVFQSYGQTFDVNLNFTQNYPQRKVMNYMDHFFSFGFNFSYYPIENIPLGLSSSFLGGNMFLYGKTISTNQNNTQGYVVDLKNTIFNSHLGLKLADQNSKSILTPYFAPRFGITRLGTTMKLSRVTDNLNETESHQLNKENINKSTGLSYSLEGGIEISPLIKKRLNEKSKLKVSISVSFVYIGSFNDFLYYNTNGTAKGIEAISGLNDYEEMKHNFKNNATLNSTRLSIWQLSTGITVRF